MRIAINGFGRIGRLVARALAESQQSEHDALQLVAINDLGTPAMNAQLLRYDSVHGRLAGEVQTSKNTMTIAAARKLEPLVIAEPDPAKLPWQELDVELVLECTGRFTKRGDAAKHLTAGAKRVVISAPCEDADYTLVYGVNHEGIKAEHTVLSNGSCTTNCLAPVAQVLHETCGIASGYMTTIHAYTGDQSMVDTLHKDPRRARAAALSLIPTSTGAAKAMGKVLPELDGRLDGSAVRVPSPNVSLVDFVFSAERAVTADALHKAMRAAAEGRLRNIIRLNDEPLVSIDFTHDAHSAVFDVTQTQIIAERLVRVLAWYDNEWGFSNRMLDVAAFLHRS